MELERWMLDEWNDQTIADKTGINIKTIRDWRKFMAHRSRLIIQEEKVQPKERYSFPPKYSTKRRKRYINERALQDAFVKSLEVPYKEYVKVPFGIVDVLTDDTIYELKHKLNRGDLQQALGQITLYGTYYPKHKKVIVANVLSISFELEEAAIKAGVEIILF
jgi:hypothetical protein